MKKWSIRDIIDLEYFFHQDAVSLSAENQQYLNERDRNTFLNSFKSSIKEAKEMDRRVLIKAWLDRRREEEISKTAVLPGESFESLYSLFRMLFVLAGFILGGAAGLSFLSYSGDRPLNVFVYLSVFVLLQILLLLLLFVLSLYRLKKISYWTSSPLYRFISRFMLRSLFSVQKKISNKLGAEGRNKAESVMGLINTKGRTYGFIFFLPVFILTQLFAIGLNLGLLATTIFKVITADIAFGWQSTLQLSPAAVHSLVQKIALPWSWLVADGLAFPSLAQIEGSRIILKEGIYHLSTPDLASWWPFLCLSVLFYGLLPRLILFLGAVATLRSRLAALNFRQGACEQLLLRMTTPMVSTHSRKLDGADGAAEEAAADFSGRDSAAADNRNGGKDLLVMIPDDIFDACPRKEIESAVRSRFASSIAQLIRINEDYETDTEILANLKNKDRPLEMDILLIQEAWQPPIVEYINFIKNLRQAIGLEPCIGIGLIGKPLSNTIFTPVLDANRKIWSRKISALRDPCIYAVGLVNHAS